MADVRGDLLAALIYDSALVSKLHEQFLHVQQLFRHHNTHSVLNHRLLAIIVYYGLCRLAHPSGLTVGEELSAGSRKPRLTRRVRLAWFLASISLPVWRESILPLIRNRSLRTGHIFDFITTLTSDAFFLLNAKAMSTSLLENVLTPRTCLPRKDVKPSVSLPSRVLSFAGLVSLVHSLGKLKLGLETDKASHKSAIPIMQIGNETEGAERLSGLSLAGGECAICMCDVDRPTATVCGHVFCWKCIFEWTSEQSSPCPVCRTDSFPQDLLPLSNYAPDGSEWKPFWNRPLILKPS